MAATPGPARFRSRPGGAHCMTDGTLAQDGLRSRAAGSGTADALIGTMLFGTMFLARFATYVGRSELSLTLVLTLVSVVTMVGLGLLRVNLTRFILFCLAIAAVTISAAFGSEGRVSTTSFILLIVLYAAYVFELPPEPGRFEWTIRLFRAFSTFIAVAGIVQFFAQIAVPGPTLFTFESFLPPKIVSHGFNYIIPVPNLPSMNKSNGFFLLEPSSFSQLMALAIILEIEFFHNPRRIIVYILGMLLSFSGTGTIMFLAFVPALLIRQGNLRLVLLFAFLAICALIFGDALHLTSLTARLGEFGSNRSSGFARFISPFYLFDDFILPHMRTTLFGYGPGSIDPFFNATDYQVHDPTWGKLFFEYGVVGSVPFMIFVIYCLFAHARSLWLSGALFFNYLLLGGNLLDARLQPFMLALVIFQGAQRDGLRALQHPAIASVDDRFRQIGKRVMVPFEQKPEDDRDRVSGRDGDPEHQRTAPALSGVVDRNPDQDRVVDKI
jgi:hypothetical protein